MCKQVKLDSNDLEEMTIGSCLDYIDEYIIKKNPDKKSEVRQANQEDYDRF